MSETAEATPATTPAPAAPRLARDARYYDTNSPRVTAAQSTLARLRKDLVSSDLPRPDETLTALAAAAGGR